MMKFARRLFQWVSAEGWISRQRQHLQRRPARYLVVGVVGAITEFSLFVALTKVGGGILFSNVIAFHCAFLLCYFLHYHYTHERPYEGARNIAGGFVKYAA